MKKILLLLIAISLFDLVEAKQGKINSISDTVNIDSLDKFVNSYIAEIYYKQVENGAPRSKFPSWEKEATQKYGEAGEQSIWALHAMTLYADFGRSRQSYDFNAWMSVKTKLHNKYPKFTDVGILNNDAYFVFLNSANKRHLEVALLWSERVIALEPTANYHDTYANLLYKLGRKSEAIEKEEKALGLDPQNQDILVNLKKMKKGVPTWVVDGAKQ